MALTEEQIAANRRIAIEALTKNPAGHLKIRGNLTNGKDGYCAVGLIGEALHFSPKLNGVNAVYDMVAQKLGLDNISFIYHMNDIGKSFSEIAAELARKWKI